MSFVNFPFGIRTLTIQHGTIYTHDVSTHMMYLPEVGFSLTYPGMMFGTQVRIFHFMYPWAWMWHFLPG
jgi:hypothetical protein